MGLREFFTSKKVESIKPSFSLKGKTITEGKGLVKTDTAFNKLISKGKEGLEDHPFSFTKMEQWSRDDPFCSGMIDKYVDFTIGAGMYLTSEDERALAVIQQYVKDINFDTILRPWIRNGFIGDGYMFLPGIKKGATNTPRVLPSETMYVRRSETGELLGYTQIIDASSGKSDDYEPWEIAHFAYKRVGTCSYGTGLVWPIADTLKKKTKLIKDMMTLMERKANAPIIVKVGNKEVPPQESDVQAVANDLEILHTKTEFAMAGTNEASVLDFGQIGDKFTQPLEQINQELFFGSQVPAVIMGMANVAEGLADIQMDAFLRVISSAQEEIEKIIEDQIFKPILTINGLPNAHVEIEWSKPTELEKKEEITTVKELLDSRLGIYGPLRFELEKKLAGLLGFKIDEDIDKQKERELNTPQPVVPGSEPRQPVTQPSKSVAPKPTPKATPKETKETKECKQYICNHVHEEVLKEDYTLQEWVGFNYQNYVQDIDEFLDSYTFPDIGGLSESQVKELRNVLKDNFSKGGSIKNIAKAIKEKVKVGDLVLPDKYDEEGNLIRKSFSINEDVRVINIARTETIRASTEGSLINYQKNDVQVVEWVSARGERTCPECDALNGTQYNLIQAQGLIPLHNMCRCRFLPIIG